MPTIELSDECLEDIILNDLKTQYEAKMFYPNVSKRDAKIAKALERVIEYYGGSVDNEREDL